MSETRQRCIALGLLGFVLAAVIRGVVLPTLHAHRVRADATRDRVVQIEHYERMASRATHVRRDLGSLEADGTISRETFAEQSAALAAATLQDRMRKVVSQAGGELMSTRVLPDAGAGPFGRVAVAARMRVDLDGLQRVLYALESGAPLLLVDKLLVRSARVTRPRRARRVLHEQLDVQIEAAGFRRTSPEAITGG